MRIWDFSVGVDDGDGGGAVESIRFCLTWDTVGDEPVTNQQNKGFLGCPHTVSKSQNEQLASNTPLPIQSRFGFD